MYKVTPYVRDGELENVLNNGLVLVRMFRNTPGSDGQETTTVIQIAAEANSLGPSVTYSDTPLAPKWVT